MTNKEAIIELEHCLQVLEVGHALNVITDPTATKHVEMYKLAIQALQICEDQKLLVEKGAANG